ncbi:MAG: helix-turn-helix domain-containing protein [Bacteroidales bacterium]|nr:helix-turn-helix domain-containing protein [Bacteroidales bacterium]
MITVGGLASIHTDYQEVYQLYSDKPLKAVKKEADSLIMADPERALALYSVVINAYKPNMADDDKYIVAGAYNNAGYIYFFKYADYTQAYEYFRRTLDMATDGNSRKLLAPTYINIGNIYSQYEETEAAISNYYRALEASYQEKDWEHMMTAAYNLISHVYHAPATDSLRSVLLTLDDTAIPATRMLTTNRCFAHSYLAHQEGRDTVAIALLGQASEAVDALYMPSRYKLLLLQIQGQLYRNLKDYPRALSCSQQALQLAQTNALPDLEAYAYDNISDIYDQWGRRDSAAHYRLKALETNAANTAISRYVAVKDLEEAFETRRAHQELQEMIQKRRTQMLVTTIIAIALVIILGLLTRLYFKNRRLRESNLELYHRVQEKLDLSIPNVNEEEEEDSEDKEKEEEEPHDDEKYRGSLLRDEDKQRLFQAITTVLETSPEVYTPEFSIERLASLVDSRYKYVSQTINELTGKNFYTLLAEQRIREACRRLNNPEMSNRLTIEGIAQDLGFKSRSNFTSVFKKVTGFTPREYRKVASSENP